jgi:iron complex outermembrane recepter protein
MELSKKWGLQSAVAWSQNKNLDFVSTFDGALQNLGKTDISFAPSLIASGTLVYTPFEGARFSWTTRHVGDQFMSNTESTVSLLPAYTVHDVSLTYAMPKPLIGKTMSVQVLANNIFSAVYSSNGYYYTYDDDFSVPDTITTVEGTGYYPQALFNILAGVTLGF